MHLVRLHSLPCPLATKQLVLCCLCDAFNGFLQEFMQDAKIIDRPELKGVNTLLLLLDWKNPLDGKYEWKNPMPLNVDGSSFHSLAVRVKHMGSRPDSIYGGCLSYKFIQQVTNKTA